MRRSRGRLSILVSILCLALPLHAEAPIRLVGSTTVRTLLEPKQAELEAAAGATIEFKGTGSMAGLVALVSGGAEAAMLSLPLEDAVQAVNRKTPGRINAVELSVESIGEIKTLFLVNPRNPVRSLSAVQLADVLTGKVANWKEVGGADNPVVVVSIGNGGSLLGQLLSGQSISSTARVVSNATQIAVIVAEQPNAIGIVSAARPRGQTTVLQTDARVNAPLLLVTKGKPTPQLRKIAETAKALLAAGQ